MRRRSRPTGARSCENSRRESTPLTSDRRFRISALQLNDLIDCYDKTEIENALNSIPDTIEEMYRRKLEHVKIKDRPRLAHIFYWVSYSIDQLTLDQISSAPGVNLPESRDVFDLCPSGLIRLEKKQPDKKGSEFEIVAFDHPSVRRFLHSKDTEQSQISIFYLSEKMVHSKITNWLLDCLSQLDQSQLSPSVMHTKPFLQYAASNWYKHLKRSDVLRKESETRNKVISLFGEPMSPTFLNWMRVANPEAEVQNVNLSEDACPSPLYIAVYVELLDLAKYLIDGRSYINASGGEFGTVLQLACYRGFIGIVMSLISQGAGVNIQAGVFGTALQAASAAGRVDVVGALLDKDADPNSMSGALGSPVQAALTGGHLSIVQMLNARGAAFDRKRNRVWAYAFKNLEFQSSGEYKFYDSPFLVMLSGRYLSKSLKGLQSKQKLLLGLIRLWKTPQSEMMPLLYPRYSERFGEFGLQMHNVIVLSELLERGMEAIDSEHFLYRSCFWALLIACTTKVSQRQTLTVNANFLFRFIYSR